MTANLKKHLDSHIGDHGYVKIIRHDGAFLCEGILSELRANPLWGLLDEDGASYSKAYSFIRDNGKMGIAIHLRRRV